MLVERLHPQQDQGLLGMARCDQQRSGHAHLAHHRGNAAVALRRRGAEAEIAVQRRTAGPVALRAVDVEDGAGALLERPAALRIRQRRYRRSGLDHPDVQQRGQLIGGAPVRIVEARIELRGLEAQRIPGRSGVAGEALCGREQRPPLPVDVDIPALGDEGRIGTLIVERVGKAGPAAVRVSEEKPGLESPSSK